MPESRILLVEDEPIVAMNFAAILQDEGYEVVGPAASVDHALGIIDRQGHLDGALVDITLRGQAAGPIAEALGRRGVRFAFVTGYDREGIPDGFRHAPLVKKPCRAVDLLEAARKMRCAQDRGVGFGPAGCIGMTSDVQGVVH